MMKRNGNLWSLWVSMKRETGKKKPYKYIPKNSWRKRGEWSCRSPGIPELDQGQESGEATTRLPAHTTGERLESFSQNPNDRNGIDRERFGYEVQGLASPLIYVCVTSELEKPNSELIHNRVEQAEFVWNL
ncbi:uncharacterized protein PGTG_09031 [Puccinia graminis f. sp. tritici CRL 75-36-700-3]|uniref:Uncharacterized protein n=1 Tax=Puccinia graminis f. sp. tritici (strain CRL 75-36-700-3 / race SCCL) TaxID=418459 RepID=E3KFL4_PUCGT|nr:uncharacterized protein PGTG_09031 [Puccinia graminis f. sp. tritici CRL 75-36-700-3]EFP83078.1 hypothetical protein PGTG_09031 [Puccinia graminis f. sp. tritici CRL 75-36-700-3]